MVESSPPTISLFDTNSPVRGDRSQQQNGALENGSDSSSPWQLNKSGVKERFEYIFDHQLHCDIHFIVGSGSDTRKIGAHKMVLWSASDIFYTNFERWSKNDTEIKILDVDPAAFTAFLKYLYSDKVSFTPETVMAVWYIGHKYNVSDLENRCVDFLLSQLLPENAFNILIEGKNYNSKKLVDACLEMICINTVVAVGAEDFCNIDNEALCSVLKRSDLTIPEITLFEAVLRWSETACIKRNLPVNLDNQRLVLGNALSLIRFSTMSSNEFASKVIDSKLLSDSDEKSILVYFAKEPKPSISFNMTPRRGFYVASRYQNEAIGSCGSFHSLVFRADQSISVMGIGLYGSTTEPAKYSVQLTFRNESSTEVLSELSGIYDGPKKIFRVMLKKPVILCANVSYQFDVTIQGDYTFHGTNGKETITLKLTPDTNVNIYLVQTSPRRGGRNPSLFGISNQTDVKGQIPEILFSR